jgi:hypothetical protein
VRNGGNLAYATFLFMPEGSFTCRKSTTWDRRLYFTSRFLSPLKIHRPRSGSNPRTLGPVASTLTTSPPSATIYFICRYIKLTVHLSFCVDVTRKLCLANVFSVRNHSYHIPVIMNHHEFIINRMRRTCNRRLQAAQSFRFNTRPVTRTRLNQAHALWPVF